MNFEVQLDSSIVLPCEGLIHSEAEVQWTGPPLSTPTSAKSLATGGYANLLVENGQSLRVLRVGLQHAGSWTCRSKSSSVTHHIKVLGPPDPPTVALQKTETDKFSIDVTGNGNGK